MSTLYFPIQLAQQTVAAITVPRHALPANDSPSLRGRGERTVQDRSIYHICYCYPFVFEVARSSGSRC